MNAYTPIASQTLTAAASSVTFSGISSAFRDLVVIVVAPGSTTLEARIRLNGDTGANYFYVRMSGSGSAATAGSGFSQSSGFLSVVAKATATQALQLNIQIMDYSSTAKFTSIISRAKQSANGSEAFANRWANTAAVTSVEIFTSTGNWASGSSFALYGIEA